MNRIDLPHVAGRRNERQDYAVELILGGTAVEDALETAGYASGYSASHFMASPAVQAALKVGRSDTITGMLATRAMLVMEALLDSKSDAARFTAAKWLLEAAGHGQKGDGDGRSKALHEMTEDELRGFMAKAQQVVDQGGNGPIITITPHNGAE